MHLINTCMHYCFVEHPVCYIVDVAETNFDDIEGVDHCIGDGKAAHLVQSVLHDMT